MNQPKSISRVIRVIEKGKGCSFERQRLPINSSVKRETVRRSKGAVARKRMLRSEIYLYSFSLI
jgi:hypothetical protein